jgi:hypothetical protein
MSRSSATISTLIWNPRPGWGEEQGIAGNPIHQAVLVWMGVGIVENMDLEPAITDVHAAEGRYRYVRSKRIHPLARQGMKRVRDDQRIKAGTVLGGSMAGTVGMPRLGPIQELFGSRTMQKLGRTTKRVCQRFVGADNDQNC